MSLSLALLRLNSHEFTLTFTVDQLDPTLPRSQTLSSRRLFSEECSNVNGPPNVRVVCMNAVRRSNGSVLQAGRTTYSRPRRRHNRTFRYLPPRAKVPYDQNRSDRGLEPSRRMAQFPSGRCGGWYGFVGERPSHLKVFFETRLGTRQCASPLARVCRD